MPYDKDPDHPECPSDKPIGVIKTTDGELMGCHATEESADDQIAALYAAEEERMAQKQNANIVVSIQDGLIEAFSALHDGIQAAAGGHGVSQVEKPDDVPEDEWNAAVKKAANTIISQYEANDKTAPDSVYEAAGKEPPKEDSRDRAIGLGQIFQQVDMALYQMESWPWLLDLYMEDGEMFAVAASGGKLYRFAVNLEGSAVTIGEGEEVEPLFKSVGAEETPRTRTKVFREASGLWRWLSISCTAVLNRVGEIDTRALFDSMVAHARETGEYPYRTFYHCGEALRYGQCDYLARDGYCLISSGLFDTEGENGDLALAEIEARQKDPETWGESIGFIPTAEPEFVLVADGIQVLAFNEGVAREISCVLESDAAALFTQSTTQEVSRMRDKIKAALEKLGITQERIDEMEEEVDSTNRTIPEEGLIARDNGGEGEEGARLETEPEPPDALEPEPGEEEEEGNTEPEPVDLEIGEDVITGVADEVMARLLDPESVLMQALSGVSDAVDSLLASSTEIQEASEAAHNLFDQRIMALEQADEEKREQWLEDLPRRSAVRLSYRPREAHAKAPEGEEGNPESEPKDYAAQAEATISQITAAY